MTKGINTMTLNTATVIEAVAYWLEHKVWKQDEAMPTVMNIAATGYQNDEFIVTLKAAEVVS